MPKQRFAVLCLALVTSGATAVGLYSFVAAGETPPARGLSTAPVADASGSLGDRLVALAIQDQPEAAGEAPGGIPHAPGRKFLGINDGGCALCHSKANESAAIPGIAAGVTDDGWAMLNEVQTWGQHDKHYQAWSVLLNERSQQMARLMGVVDGQGQSQIHRDVRCLTCHAGLPVDQMNAGENGFIPVELANDTKVNLGVSCESCHGASGDGEGGVKGWVDIHRFKDRWRFESPEWKWSEHGYYDVRSPVSKTRLCASCHIGNADEGRIVTHEMYAAGHPPLPGFEVETFIHQEPQHWRDFGQKKEAIRNEFLEKTGTTYDPAHLHHTKKLLIGALVNLSTYLEATGDLAAGAAMPIAQKPDWPELAQFACYACHHDLKTPAWRQERGYFVTPGRPVPYEWPVTLVALSVEAAGRPASEIGTRQQKLAAPIDARPFGDPDTLPAAARELAAWANGVAGEIEKKDLTRADGQALLERIAELATKHVYDYDSARQLVWAFNVVYQDMKVGRDEVPFNPVKQEIGWLARRETLDPLEQKLASLESILLLDLRKGRETQQAVAGQERPVLEVDLAEILPPITRYEPTEFQTRFREIARLLDE
ncbi:MAG: cytochrome c family protein [Planctomycetes bacterium]|nr:cytochrome c family protein [Planctomycetota bacterium]